MRIFTILGLVFFSTSAFSQTSSSFQNCQGASEPRARVASCSAVLRNAELTDTQRAAILTYRGNAFFALEMTRRALNDYHRAVRLAPGNTVYLFNRGAALSKLGRYDEAIGTYSTVIRYNPRDAEAHNNRAWARLKRGRLQLALADVQRALALRDDFAEAYDTRGHIYLGLNQSNEAIADFQRAIRLDPSNQSALDGLRQASTSAR